MTEGTAGTTYPELLAAARECASVWNQLQFPLNISGDHEIRFRVGFPMAAHALNHVTLAVDTLEGLPLVGAGLARVALEHALAAQWVLWTRGGPETLTKHMEAAYLTRTRAFARAVEGQPDLTQFVDQADLDALTEVASREPASGAERAWSMQTVFDRFSDTDLFYDMYRELSGAVHPSYATIQTYLGTGSDGVPATVSRRGHSGPSHTAAQAAALAGVLALDFLERCQDTPPQPSPAATIAVRVNLPHDLSASDRHPDRQPP